MKQKLFSSICLVLAIVIVVTTSTTFAYLIASSENTTDVSGKTVQAMDRVSKEINLSNLKTGVYILSVKYVDGTTSTEKIVKK